MYQYHCLNPISQLGLDNFTENYQKTEAAEASDAILVRSASMHEMELPENMKVVARAVAGVNNIPLDRCAEKGIVVFNKPGANANGVKELVIAGMLLAARVARAVAGVNNIPLDRCAEKGIVVFNKPGANANGVKELVIAGMLLAAR